jgi:hypothetical protein
MPSSFAAVPPRIATRWSSPSAAPAWCATPWRGSLGDFQGEVVWNWGPPKTPVAALPSTSPVALSIPDQRHRGKLAGHSRRGGRRRPIYRRVDLRHEPFGLARRRRNQRFHPGTGGHRQHGGSGRQLRGDRARSNLRKHIVVPRSSQRVHGRNLRCVQYRTRLRGPLSHRRLGLLYWGGQPARLFRQVSLAKVRRDLEPRAAGGRQPGCPKGVCTTRRNSGRLRHYRQRPSWPHVLPS